MGKIFVTSDTHFGHDKEFIWRERGFSSIDEMNEEIIVRWNKIVDPEDTVYHLGDVMLGDNQNGLKCLSRLNGQIHIVAGNHDTVNRIQLYKEAGYDVVYATQIKYKGYTFYLSHYPTLTANLEKESLKQCVCNLYGHTHQKTNFYNEIPFMYHVGIDSHECYPISLDYIIFSMERKANECLSFLD